MEAKLFIKGKFADIYILNHNGKDCLNYIFLKEKEVKKYKKPYKLFLNKIKILYKMELKDAIKIKLVYTWRHKKNERLIYELRPKSYRFYFFIFNINEIDDSKLINKPRYLFINYSKKLKGNDKIVYDITYNYLKQFLQEGQPWVNI